MHLPPLRQLQYLIALRDSLHFGRAAQSLHVTQSTLSTGIKELESTLGVKLVDRAHRAVTFTEIGEATVTRARGIILQSEELLTHARSLADPLSFPIRLGAIPTIAPYLVADYISRIKSDFPRLKLYIRENTTANLVQELGEGKLDMIILAFPYGQGKLGTRIMFREKLLLAYHEETRLIPRGQVSFNSLPDESLLLLDDGHCLRDHALAGCRLKSDKKIHTFGANSLQMLIQMVDNDLGVTLVPEMALSAGILRGTRIKTTRLPSRDFYRDIGFAWRKGNYREARLLELMDALPLPNAQLPD